MTGGTARETDGGGLFRSEKGLIIVMRPFRSSARFSRRIRLWRLRIALVVNQTVQAMGVGQSSLVVWHLKQPLLLLPPPVIIVV